MPTRRDFLKRAAALSAAGLCGASPAAIRRAWAIAPDPGSTYLDAEHVVILMQENRSFDHAFGTLRGVRGFNDPRAITLPDGHPVWAQADAAGDRYVPFRLDIKQTKATWMGSLPHGWPDQVDATNGGRHDRWLRVKRSGHREYARMPLALGYYTRADIPFYYALADAFTICDQYFCSSLTGTTPNRLHLWTGTVRARPTTDSPALVRNEDCDYGQWVSWPTFPERLEDHGISWKIYQNELSVPNGLEGEADAWLANFGDSPLEWFTQFHVRFAENHRKFLDERIQALPGEIEAMRKQLAARTDAEAGRLRRRLAEATAQLERFRKDRATFTPESFAKLSPREKSLHARAFVTNAGDPAYRELAEITYRDGDTPRTMKVPRGDVLHQLRKDVADGTLPTVSWLVAPENLSDHPTSAWYGSWYLSEVLDILTKDPRVWKKTIFILTYDENDGYFDHVPPFLAPHPKRPETGRATAGIDTAVEYVEREQDRKHKPTGAVRDSAIGLGYRVPLIIASPWTRGGCVCSQVFDHTSVLQLLERLLTHKTGAKVEEPNISAWRRTVCGDLTAAFRPAADDRPGLSRFLQRDPFVAEIHQAQFRGLPSGYRPLTEQDLERIRTHPRDSALPRQEPGVRPSSPLPYELAVDGALDRDRGRFTVRFEARKDQLGERAAGSPFIAYAFTAQGVEVRHYTVAAGGRLEDSWPLDAFDKGRYDLRVHGPNGFFRSFAGSAEDPAVDLRLEYVRVTPGEPKLSGDVAIHAHNGDARERTVTLTDHAYGAAGARRALAPGGRAALAVEARRSAGWYDVGVRVVGVPGFEKRYAGRVETGEWSSSDPAMGK